VTQGLVCAAIVLAEATPPFTSKLEAYGVAGICLGFFMLLEWDRRKRDGEREKREAERETKREEAFFEALESLRAEMGDVRTSNHHVAQAILLDMLDRPELNKKIRDDASRLLTAIDKKP
jgi:hypothetical protein